MFSEVLDALNDEEKERLLIAAGDLMKAQNVIRIGSAKPQQEKQNSSAKKEDF